MESICMTNNTIRIMMKKLHKNINKILINNINKEFIKLDIMMDNIPMSIQMKGFIL